MKWRSLPETVEESGTRRLYEIYAERRELISKYVPAEIQAVHARVVEELRNSGAAQATIQAGATAPDFQLPDQNGNVVRSADFLERGFLVICFIRGRWCPFCVGQMEAMNAIIADLGRLGASLVAISPQTVHQSFLMADQHKLRFPLLSDTGNQVARQFGLAYRVPGYQQEVYRRAFVNLPFVNGDDSWELPIPATYILSGSRESAPQNAPSQQHTAKQQGQPATSETRLPLNAIVYAKVDADYTNRPEPAEVLARIAQLLA